MLLPSQCWFFCFCDANSPKPTLRAQKISPPSQLMSRVLKVQYVLPLAQQLPITCAQQSTEYRQKYKPFFFSALILYADNAFFWRFRFVNCSAHPLMRRFYWSVHCDGDCFWRQPKKKADIPRHHCLFSAKWRLGNERKTPYWWRVTSQIWVVPLIGCSKFPTWHDQIKTLLTSG